MWPFTHPDLLTIDVPFLDKQGHHYILFESPCPCWAESISFRKVIHPLCFSEVHLYMALTIPCLEFTFLAACPLGREES